MEIAESLLQAIPHIEDNDWLLSAWDAELMTLPDPPEELEDVSTETTKLLGKIAHAMRKEVVNIQGQSEGEDEEENNQETIYGLWDALRSLDLDYRQMLPVLCYFISNGTSNFEDTDLRNLGLQATSCYFLLLSVPGSVTHNMYHSIMFTHGLNTLKLAIKICTSKKKPTKRSKNSEKSTENEEEEQEEEERLQLSESQRLELLSQLKVVLADLLLLLQHFSLKRRHDAMNHTIQQLIELTYLEHDTCTKNFNVKKSHSSANPSTLAATAYNGLRLVCSQLHGNVDECVTTVMEHIYGVLTNTHQSLSLDLAPRELNVTRENAFNFAMYLVKDLGKPAWNGISILFQHILTRFTEKADNRLRCAQLATQLLNGVPVALRNRLCTWLWALGHAEKPAYRLMALELASHLLHQIQFEHADPDAMETNEQQQQEQPDEEKEHEEEGADSAEKVDAETGEEAEKQMEEEDGEEKSPGAEKQKRQSNSEKFALRHSHLLLLILYRCDDQAPTVRAKALSAVAELAANLNEIAELPCEQLLHNVLQGGLDEDRPFPEHDDVIAAVNQPEAPLPAGRAVLEVITDMAEDERVVVRKAALGALVNLALVSRRWLHNKLIKVLSLHCRDPAMSVRKQVLQGLTMLLKVHGTDVPGLPESWLSSVLPALQDPEIRICEFVVDLSREVVLDPLQPYNTAGASDLPWQLMKLIPKHDMQNLLISALRTWAKDKLPKNLMSCLESHVGTENNAEAWMMLAILAEMLKPRDPNFSLTHLKEQLANLSPDTDLPVTRNIMRTLLLTMAQIKEAERVQLRNLLYGRIQALSLPIELIPIALDLVAATEIAGKNKDAVSAAVKAVSGHCQKLLKGIEEVLHPLLGHQKHNESQSQEQLLVRQVATLGDAVRVGNLKVSNKTVRVLHSMLVGQYKTLAHVTRLKVKPRTLRVNVSPLLRAITIISLGKLALQNETIAHELIPAFGLLLDYDKSSVLRNNVLCALADLCGRYAVLVDPLVPRMAACLRSDDVALRKQTLVLMVQLLQEDYVKLRHGLIFFLLRMLCDPEPELQEMTRFYLSENLLKKQPQAMFANLQAALFVFNNHEIKEEDTGGAQGAMLQREMAQLISMQGNANQEARMHIYRFMLETMQDDHRFQTTHRLCMDVLGGFSEGRLVLEGPGKSLLRDTLAVLNSDEIRLHSMHAKPLDENDVLDTEEACNNAMVTARKAVVTQVVKRNVMENIIPVIRSLKTKLQAVRSPIAEDLMNYLRDLMRDFKSEIKEILAGDRQLAAEVAFDIRQLEERGEPVRQSIAPPRIDDDLEGDHTAGTENKTAGNTQGSSAGMSQDSSIRESQDSAAEMSQSSPLATPLKTTVGSSQSSPAATPLSKAAAKDIEMSSQDETSPGSSQKTP